jgi:large subunit ribosomal protein L25
MMRGFSEVPHVNAKAKFELAGEARPHLGRTDARRLRRQGKVPAVVYGGGEGPLSVVLDHNALNRQMNREA